MGDFPNVVTKRVYAESPNSHYNNIDKMHRRVNATISTHTVC